MWSIHRVVLAAHASSTSSFNTNALGYVLLPPVVSPNLCQPASALPTRLQSTEIPAKATHLSANGMGETASECASCLSGLSPPNPPPP